MQKLPIQELSLYDVVQNAESKLPVAGVGVYFVVYRDQIVYIGKSEHVSTRIRAHLLWMADTPIRNFILEKEPGSVRLFVAEIMPAKEFCKARGTRKATEAITLVEAAEAYFINKFKPPFNVSRPCLTKKREEALEAAFTRAG